MAVFVHGCFWHRCSRHAWKLPKANREYWRLKFALNRERDRRKARELRADGWRVLTIWECEIRRNPQRCAQRIRTAIGAPA